MNAEELQAKYNLPRPRKRWPVQQGEVYERASAHYSASLKMPEKWFRELEAQMNECIRRNREAFYAYAHGMIPRAEKVHDINKRLRWDLYWKGTSGPWRRALHREAPGMNNEHIDAALRRMVPRIERKF